MWKIYLIGLFVIITLSSNLKGQSTGSFLLKKQSIDTNCYGFANWPGSNYTPKINADGSFASFLISMPGQAPYYTLRSLRTDWQITWNGSFPQFSKSPKLCAFVRNDSLMVIDLISLKSKFISVVENNQFKMTEQGVLLYYGKQKDRTLFVYNCLTQESNQWIGVHNYWLNANQSSIVLDRETDSHEDEVSIFNLRTGSSNIVWHGYQMADMAFSPNGKSLALLTNQSRRSNTEKFIYLFSIDANATTTLSRTISDSLLNGAKISRIIGYGQDSKRFLFETSPEFKKKVVNRGTPQVDVWSYLDPTLQSQQLISLKKPSSSLVYAVNLTDGYLGALNSSDEMLLGNPLNLVNSKYVLTAYQGNGTESCDTPWNKTAFTTLYLTSTEDGKKIRLTKPDYDSGVRYYYFLSPDGHFVIYYDPHKQAYFSFDINAGLTRCITGHLRTEWTHYFSSEYWDIGESQPIGIGGWLFDNKKVLLCGRNDIFLVDPSGQEPLVKLTGDYGRRHELIFSVANSDAGDHAEQQIKLINGKLLLKAVNVKSKDEGYFYADLQGKNAPQRLSMQPASFGPLIKAVDKDVFLVSIMSAERFPNLYYTNDFKSFHALTDVHPEKKYNWLKAQLLTWKLPNGTRSQGILYMPENFDPSKKYPVILKYYQKLADEFHKFLIPDWSSAEIDIPTYVGRGYLVFEPDFHYHVGHTGEDILKTATSVYQFLSKFQWVDAQRIGLNGHSFGGLETDYIITHSHLFAAACSGSGWADQISMSNNIYSLTNGKSHQNNEIGNHMNLGVSFWERPDLYILNSAIFDAFKVTTPVLMMNNKADGDVDFNSGGVEFFTALRRLGKRAWMLQYDGEKHQLYAPVNQKDYSIRMLQFFDHYLLGKPAPIWMTRGIPAALKGTESGYAYDNDIKTPGPGLLTPQAQKKLDHLQKRKPITVVIR